MSDKLKVIGSDELFEAIYPGDTAYRAFRDASGTLVIIELPSRDTEIVAADEAADLIDSLRNASDFHRYDDGQINAINIGSWRARSSAFTRRAKQCQRWVMTNGR
jgi:hypothetical protein